MGNSKYKKYPSKYPGVSYRKHETRKFNGRAQRYFIIRYQNDGKQKEESIGWESEHLSIQDASSLRELFAKNCRTGNSPQSLNELKLIKKKHEEEKKKELEKEKKESLLFNDAANQLIQHMKDEDKDWVNTKSRYNNHIKNELGNRKLKDITPQNCEKIKIGLKKKGLSPKTVSHCLAVIRRVYNFVIDQELYDGRVPTARVNFPSKDNRRLRYLTKEEAALLLKKLKKKSYKDYCYSVLSLGSGMRFKEIAQLKWSDVDLNSEVFNVKDTKNGTTRQVRITPPVLEILNELKKSSVQNTNNYLLPNEKGERQIQIGKKFYKTVKELGFNKNKEDKRDHVVFHTLRHTYASWLVQKGIPLYDVQNALGHNSITMTQRYSKLAPDNMKAVADKLADVFPAID